MDADDQHVYHIVLVVVVPVMIYTHSFAPPRICGPAGYLYRADGGLTQCLTSDLVVRRRRIVLVLMDRLLVLLLLLLLLLLLACR